MHGSVAGTNLFLQPCGGCPTVGPGQSRGRRHAISRADDHEHRGGSRVGAGGRAVARRLRRRRQRRGRPSAATAQQATDDGGGQTDATSGTDPGTESDGSTDGDASASGSSGGGGSRLFLDGEEIVLGPGRCYLQEQPAAAGGGSILATAQAQGTNAAGDDVRIDFTRYSADSQFAGDDVNIDVGPLGASEGHGGSAPEGAVTVEGNVVSSDLVPDRRGSVHDRLRDRLLSRHGSTLPDPSGHTDRASSDHSASTRASVVHV